MDIMKDEIPDIDFPSHKGMLVDLAKIYFSKTRQQIPVVENVFPIYMSNFHLS